MRHPSCTKISSDVHIDYLRTALIKTRTSLNIRGKAVKFNPDYYQKF